LPDESRFVFVGELDCLNFVNTKIAENGEEVELLRSLADFFEWFREAGITDRPLDVSLIDSWASESNEDTFQAIRDFRETLRHTIDRMREGGEPSEDGIGAINTYRNRPFVRMTLRRESGGWQEVRQPRPKQPLDCLAPLAEDAAKLVTERDRDRIKKCSNPECVLYYYDVTKNDSRKWCSMDLCGNRMKARRHYERQKQESQD